MKAAKVITTAIIALLILGIPGVASANAISGAIGEQVCENLQHVRLLDEPGNRQGPVIATDLQPGVYDIVLTSGDPSHAEGVDHGGIPQDFEQWVLIIEHGSQAGLDRVTRITTPDLDADLMEQSWKFENVELEWAARIQAVHAGLGPDGNVQSVDPISACFTPVSFTEVTTTTAVPETTTTEAPVETVTTVPVAPTETSSTVLTPTSEAPVEATTTTTAAPTATTTDDTPTTTVVPELALTGRTTNAAAALGGFLLLAGLGFFTASRKLEIV